MRRLIFLSIICVLFASCNTNMCTISGVVDAPELEGKTVYCTSSCFYKDLSSPDPTIDSTIITNGKYSFKLAVVKPDYCTIHIPDESNHITYNPFLHETIAIEKGIVKVYTDNKLNTTVSGTPFNDTFNQFNQERKKVQDRFNIAYNRERNAKGEQLSEEERNKIAAEIAECRRLFVEMDYNFVKENINNPAVWDMKLYNSSITAGSVEEKKELIAGADEYTKTLPVYKYITEQIDKLERTSIGHPFTDFKMLDPNDKEVSLSDYVGKGKYVLVDFWASWCGPCRAEMPNVVKTYKKYAGEDFEIVGVSLDRSKENWVKAINEMDLPWPHMSDLKGWDCAAAKIYAVTAVPHTILFDKEGKILARNLHGEALYTRLGELLK